MLQGACRCRFLPAELWPEESVGFRSRAFSAPGTAFPSRSHGVAEFSLNIVGREEEETVVRQIIVVMLVTYYPDTDTVPVVIVSYQTGLCGTAYDTDIAAEATTAIPTALMR